MKTQNYRKAKKNETSCKDCARSFKGLFTFSRLKCGELHYRAVGKNMTCDAVVPTKWVSNEGE